MQIIDPIAGKPIREAQVYLTTREAMLLKQRLEVLLQDPEAAEHFHLFCEGGRDLSFSIVTPAKLASGMYTALEQQILADMNDA